MSTRPGNFIGNFNILSNYGIWGASADPYTRNGSIIGSKMNLGDNTEYIIGTETVNNTLVYVGGTTFSYGGGTGNLSIPLTSLTGGIASSPASTDLVIAVWSQYYDPTAMPYRLTNLTQMVNTTANGVYPTGFQAGRAFGVTSVTVSGGTQTTSYAGAMSVHVWRNVNPTNPLDSSIIVSNTINTARPDPPAVTTTTPGAVIIAGGGNSHVRGAFSFGSTLSNFRTTGGNSSGDTSIGMGSFLMTTSGTYNPTQWSFGGVDDVAFSAPSFTVALRPSTSVVTIYGNKKNSGIWDLHTVRAFKLGT